MPTQLCSDVFHNSTNNNRASTAAGGAGGGVETRAVRWTPSGIRREHLQRRSTTIASHSALSTPALGIAPFLMSSLPRLGPHCLLLRVQLRANESPRSSEVRRVPRAGRPASDAVGAKATDLRPPRLAARQEGKRLMPVHCQP